MIYNLAENCENMNFRSVFRRLVFSKSFQFKNLIQLQKCYKMLKLSKYKIYSLDILQQSLHNIVEFRSLIKN